MGKFFVSFWASSFSNKRAVWEKMKISYYGQKWGWELKLRRGATTIQSQWYKHSDPITLNPLWSNVQGRKRESQELENFPRGSKFYLKSKAVQEKNFHVGERWFRRGISYNLCNSLDIWQASPNPSSGNSFPRLTQALKSTWTKWFEHIWSNCLLLFACSSIFFMWHRIIKRSWNHLSAAVSDL